LPSPIERLRCPEHFQTRLNEVGGVNRYDEPNFKLAWAQTETMRQGGEWDNEDGHFIGYRDVYLGDGHPHWMLLQWVDAGRSIQGPHIKPSCDIAWYQENRCLKTGLQLLGEYPYHGSYQVALPLVAKWFDEHRRLQLRAFPLSTEIVEMMVPIIKASMLLSIEVKLRFMKDEAEKDDIEFGKQVDAAYNSVKLPASARGSAWIADKVISLEKHFNRALVEKMHRDRVFQSHGGIR
jgi:hypothetical protein